MLARFPKEETGGGVSIDLLLVLCSPSFFLDPGARDAPISCILPKYHQVCQQSHWQSIYKNDGVIEATRRTCSSIQSAAWWRKK